MNVIAYSYFRSPASIYEKEKGNAGLQFAQFLPLLIRGHHYLFPGWGLHIYHDAEVKRLPYWGALELMARRGLLWLTERTPEPLCRAMLWRALPVWDPAADVVVMRDVDTVPSVRDAVCVTEFLRSGLGAHVVHDNPAHSGIMGGTFAVRAGYLRETMGWRDVTAFRAAQAAFPADWDKQGADQHFLNGAVLPRIRRSLLLHALCGLGDRGMGLPPENVRASVAVPAGFQDPPADAFRGVGVCWAPAPALVWYDGKEFPARERIRACEREAGV